MKNYLIKRILSLIPVMLIVASLVFTIQHLTPGNPADVILGDEASPEEVRELEHRMGFDKPIIVQLGIWFSHLLRGDLGESIYYNKPVTQILFAHLIPTLQLTLMAMTVNIMLGLTTGVFAAAFHNTRVDNVLMFFASIIVSLPISWIGLVLMLAFSLYLPIFPVSGYVSFLEAPLASMFYLTLPAVTIGAGAAARLSRMTRANMLEVLRSDYILAARAKGVGKLMILFKHALKNSFIPILTVIGLSLAAMMGGAVVSEQIFGIPGMGKLLIFAVFNRDYPIVQGIVLFIAFIYVFINLIIDIIYALVDPRIAYE